MPAIELPEPEMNRLLTVLKRNEIAVDAQNAVRWDERSTSEIESIRTDIETQLNQ